MRNALMLKPRAATRPIRLARLGADPEEAGVNTSPLARLLDLLREPTPDPPPVVKERRFERPRGGFD